MEIRNLKQEEEFEQLIMLGDIHGAFNIVEWLLKQRDLRNTAIFQVGDFGRGFARTNEIMALGHLNRKLRERNCFLYAIRGNHDDPAIFQGPDELFDRIVHVADWTLLDITIDGKDHRIFCLGGAVSIDRKPRTANVDWWPGEVVNWDRDVSVFEKIQGVTLIVTHTAPDTVLPMAFHSIVYDYANQDADLLRDLELERRLMTDLIGGIIDANPTVEKAYYGHFHFSASIEWKGVEFKLLNVNEACSVL